MTKHEFCDLTYKLVDTVCEQDNACKQLQAKYNKCIALLRKIADKLPPAKELLKELGE